MKIAKALVVSATTFLRACCVSAFAPRNLREEKQAAMQKCKRIPGLQKAVFPWFSHLGLDGFAFVWRCASCASAVQSTRVSPGSLWDLKADLKMAGALMPGSSPSSSTASSLPLPDYLATNLYFETTSQVAGHESPPR